MDPKASHPPLVAGAAGAARAAGRAVERAVAMGEAAKVAGMAVVETVRAELGAGLVAEVDKGFEEAAMAEAVGDREVVRWFDQVQVYKQHQA